MSDSPPMRVLKDDNTYTDEDTIYGPVNPLVKTGKNAKIEDRNTTVKNQTAAMERLSKSYAPNPKVITDLNRRGPNGTNRKNGGKSRRPSTSRKNKKKTKTMRRKRRHLLWIFREFTSTYANFVLQIKDDEYVDYIYYLLKLNKDNIMDLANFSVKIGHIQYGKLAKLKIKIPKNKQLVTDMESTFQEIETLQMEIKSAEELYKQYIQELGNEAKQGNIIANNDESKVVIIEQVQEPIIRKIK